MLFVAHADVADLDVHHSHAQRSGFVSRLAYATGGDVIEADPVLIQQFVLLGGAGPGQRRGGLPRALPPCSQTAPIVRSELGSQDH